MSELFDYWEKMDADFAFVEYARDYQWPSFSYWIVPPLYNDECMAVCLELGEP